MRRIICVAGVIGCVALSVPQSAYAVSLDITTFLVTVEQVGPNVVVTGSGYIDLTGLTGPSTGSAVESAVIPQYGGLTIGPAIQGVSSADVDIYSSVFGPSNFGSGPFQAASAGTGDEVGFNVYTDQLYVPAGYTSGNPLSDTSTYDGFTLTSLGLTPGTYNYTYGTADPPAITVEILAVSATPLPAALPLFATGLGALGLFGWRRKQKNASAIGVA